MGRIANFSLNQSKEKRQRVHVNVKKLHNIALTVSSSLLFELV